MKTTTTWKTAHSFSSQYGNGASIDIDAKAGFSPKALLLSGLAGCSGVDVVDILEKMRVTFNELQIEASAHQTEDHPRVFQSVQLTYRIRTDEGNREKVVKAIELSLDKYCGVAAMLKKNSPIEYELILTQ